MTVFSEVPRLKCLDVENVPAFTNDVAAHTLSGLALMIM